MLHTQGLQREGHVHHRRRVSLGGGQVDHPATREQVEPPAVGELVLIDEGAHPACGAGGDRTQLVEIELDVEVAGVGQQRAVLHALEMLAPEDPSGTGHGDKDVPSLGRLQCRHHLIAAHPRLERPQRVDLADDHGGAGASRALGDALPGPAVADHHDRMSGQQHVAGPHDPVQRRLTRPVAIVQRALGARLVGRDHRAQQGLAILKPAQAHEPGGRFLDAPDDRLDRLGAELVGGHQQIGAVVDGDLGGAGQQRAHVSSIRREILAPDRVDLEPVVSHERGRHVVLGRQRVGRAERRARPAGGQGEHQVRRLGGDVQAGGHPHARERALAGEALVHRAQHRHLIPRPGDPGRAIRREPEIGYLMGRSTGDRHDTVL